MRRELELFPEWFLARHHRVALTESERQGLATVFDCILAVNLAEPKVFVHRDYHSRNLMRTDATGAGNPGIIDFQDAVFGPIWFDLMGVQRHLKVLGIFARLYHRDGKDGYLKDLPLVARYLRKACERYAELSPLRKLLDKVEDKITVLGYSMDKPAA